MNKITVELCHIDEQQQLFFVSLRLLDKATVRDAIDASGFLEQNHLDTINCLQCGIFGKKTSLETALQEGDRVEIYRPLKITPLEARRLRAIKSKG